MATIKRNPLTDKILRNTGDKIVNTCGECDNCDPGTTVASKTITLSKPPENLVDCTDCDEVPLEIIVTRTESCTWEYGPVTLTCGEFSAKLEVTTGAMTVTFTFVTGSGTFVAIYEKTQAGPFDCSNEVTSDINDTYTFASQTANSPCDWNAAGNEVVVSVAA